MLNEKRRLAFLAIFTCILLMTSLYAILPVGRLRPARQEVEQIVIKTPRHFVEEVELAVESSLSLTAFRDFDEDDITLAATAYEENETTTESPTTQAPPIDICPDGPKTNLYFLKTHKTGSSTLQNILVRYAWGNNLLIGLPQSDIIYGSYYHGKKFTKAQMQSLPAGTKPNMLLHHMVFDHDEVASVLPSNSVYFTILRDPATQFESVYKYFIENVTAFKRSKNTGGLKEYVTHPTKYFNGSQDGRFWWFAKNGVFFDLGFDNLSDNEEYIDQSIQEVEKIFDLVLISEYFDISLLLLKDLLCWDMRDMAYLSMNRRNFSTVEHVADDVIEKIYNWNKADTALYKHFNKTFWMQVDAYGKSRLEKDLQLLEKSRTEIADSCVENDLYSNKDIKDKSLKMFNPKGIDLTQYKLKESAKNNETCKGLILPEVEWWKNLSRHQKQPTKKKIVIRMP